MSGNFWLDWAMMAVSLFNTIVTLWLGLTVLLNAERRSPGIWLSGCGLLLGAAFFLSHTAILGLGSTPYSRWVNYWWQLGWIPVLVAPITWYVVMLWYAGFWENRLDPIYHRHRIWLWFLLFINSGMLMTFLLADSLPSFEQIRQGSLSAVRSLPGFPFLPLFYPLYLLGCIGLSLDALLRPGPTMRIMGNLARRRARPWLAAASTALLLVGVSVIGVIVWSLLHTSEVANTPILPPFIAWADLWIAFLIGLAVVLTGQAIVSYEVFTGKTLPRRGLMRYWRRAIILAAGYSFTVSMSILLVRNPIYSLLISTTLMVVFYALIGWRSYIERERFIASLRPFVASQDLYENLLQATSDDPSVNVHGPFQALCKDILGVRSAWLVPRGSAIPLFGPPLRYPEQTKVSPDKIPEIQTQFTNPETLCIQIQTEDNHGAAWAIPLWRENGLSGILILGEKLDNSLYTQEEMEIARSAGEKLIDIQASAEMARRLMTLQRNRMSESQVMDRRARRMLHDEILPRLHTAMLTLSSIHTVTSKETDQGTNEVLALLGDVHRQIADMLHDIPPALPPELRKRNFLDALKDVLYHEFNNAFDKIEWFAAPDVQASINHLPPFTAEALFYAAREAIRNAAMHARDESRNQLLAIRVAVTWENGILIDIQDNGVGFSISPGEDDPPGHGLALHSTMMAVVGGSLTIESSQEAATCIRLYLPVEIQAETTTPS